MFWVGWLSVSHEANVLARDRKTWLNAEICVDKAVELGMGADFSISV